MSLITMAKSLAEGEIPGVSLALARNKLLEAFAKILDETDWSFQKKEGGWLAPGLVASLGTTTVTQYSNQVIGDATASAIWAGLSGMPLITQLQYRDPSYSLYNIIAYDVTTNAPFGTLTLDRPWMEPTKGPGQTYYMYQAYFPVPFSDFRKFVEIRDTTYEAPLDWLSLSQEDLALEDPQRVIFGPNVPTYAVPWGTDQRPGSSTYGNIVYELWPHVLSIMPYSFSCKRDGTALLVNQSDTVPAPLTEELLMWRAKEVLCQFKEAQKGEMVQRGAGANWMLLAEAAKKEYDARLKQVRRKDMNLHNEFQTRPISDNTRSSDGYSTMRTGLLNIGRM